MNEEEYQNKLRELYHKQVELSITFCVDPDEWMKLSLAYRAIGAYSNEIRCYTQAEQMRKWQESLEDKSRVA